MYEYKVVSLEFPPGYVLEASEPTVGKGSVEPDALETCLNAMGAEGWHFVGVIEAGGTRLVFERPKM